MPIYEFLCEKCQEVFSLQMHLADYEKGKFKCPKCKGQKVKKQLSTFQTKTSKKS
jgi:putative FmdB family regulatory protein